MNVGDKISFYSILSTIGTGGMGEVFLAEDSRLDRKAALKRLHKEYSQSSDLLRRFTQEAKSASALNHPNIVTIYEVGEFGGEGFIAMEYVEGESLRKLINGRKIGVKEAIDIAIQTAGGLSSAHAAGIIHRDIKPENIMRRPDGLIKILDFGLAKQTGDAWYMTPVTAEETTRGRDSTVAGVVMGTISYMSPEQTRGKAADSRTDVWSLGIVLYEMIAGRVPFKGESKSDTIAAILRSDLEPLADLNLSTPEALWTIVEKALKKDADQRYQTINEMLHDLKSLSGDLHGWSSSFNGAPYTTTARLPLLTKEQAARTTGGHTAIPVSAKWLLPVAALAILTGGMFLYQRSSSFTSTAVTASLEAEQVASWKSFIGEDPAGRARFSPDGTLIAFSAVKEGRKAIWLKQLSGGEPFTRKNDGSSDTSPVWSPDGQSIAYVSNRGGRLGIWSEPALGGTPRLIASLDIRPDLVRWSGDGSTIFYESQQNLLALNLADGTSEKITNFDDNPIIDRQFAISPDETRIVYSDVVNGRDDIWTIAMSGGEPRQLTNDEPEDSNPIWHPDGKRIIYNSDRSGVRQIYTVSTSGGSPQAVTISDTSNYVSDISPDGTRILYTSTRNDSDLWGISVKDGQEFQVTSDMGIEFWPDISPDGNRIIYQAARQPGVRGSIFSSNLVARDIKNVNDAELLEISPDGFDARWSPDGGRVAFLRTEVGNNSLWITPAGGGEAKVITGGGVVFGGYSMLPYIPLRSPDHAWSPDGSTIYYAALRNGISNIWSTSPDIISFAPQTALHTASLLTQDPTDERRVSENTDPGILHFTPLPSPDGRRLAWMTIAVADSKAPPVWSVWIYDGTGARKIYSSNVDTATVGWIPGTDELLIKAAETGKNPARETMAVKLVRISGSDPEPEPVPAGVLDAAYFYNIAMSARTPLLAFISRPDDADIFQVMDLRDTHPRPLSSNTNERVYYSKIVFSPDGGTVYFGRQANWQIVSMLNNFE